VIIDKCILTFFVHNTPLPSANVFISLLLLAFPEGKLQNPH